MASSPSPERAPILTTVGLLVEAQAGLVAAASKRLATAGHRAGQDFEVLLRLLRTPEHRLRMSDLAAQTTLTASGLTRAVDRLVRDGLVCREACAEDRRVSYAQLTDAGEAEIRAALAVHLEQLEELFAPYEADELAALETTLRRLRDVLNPEAASASEASAAADPEA